MELEEGSSPPSSEMEPVLSDLESDNLSPMAMDPASPAPQSPAPQSSPMSQSSPTPQSSPARQSYSSSDESMEEDRPGAPLRSYIPVLERLHQKKLALGEDPATPFADYLEFEFVKWMVEQDISQSSREKLIKLPLVSVQVIRHRHKRLTETWRLPLALDSRSRVTLDSTRYSTNSQPQDQNGDLD